MTCARAGGHPVWSRTPLFGGSLRGHAVLVLLWQTLCETVRRHCRHLAKDNVLVVEPIARIAGDKELAAIGARPTVCHLQTRRVKVHRSV